MIEFVHPYTQPVAGAGEVGRGSSIGAVITAAVILDSARPTAGLNNSKKLSEERRLTPCEEIKKKALSWNSGRMEPHEIDELNTLHTAILVIQYAVVRLHIMPEYMLIDDNRCPKLSIPSMAVVKGDNRVPKVSAVSILVKVTRGAKVTVLDIVFPQYSFAQHERYPITLHPEKLAEHGATEHHRHSSGSVKRTLGLASWFLRRDQVNRNLGMSEPRFIHLQVYSNYSMIDGLARTVSLVKKATTLGMSALTITDFTDLCGLMKFYGTEHGAGIKPIVGADFSVQCDLLGNELAYLIVLAVNNIGYQNLTLLTSKAC